MNALEYVKLSEIDPDEFVHLLNKQKVRKHLIEHALFDAETIRSWINDKQKVDSTPGCKIRAIKLNNRLVGWCGIQLENQRYEVAVVIDDKSWGIGNRVFKEIISWAKALGHDELFIHFHHTRPEYAFLRRISSKVYQSEIFGSKFTTYQLSVKRGFTRV